MRATTGRITALVLTGLIGLVACEPTPRPTGPVAPAGPTAPPTTVAPTTAPPTTAAPTTAPPTTAAPTTTTTTAPTAPAGWKLVGGDEFNGTAVDTSKWKAYHNTYGDGNNELACLTPGNVAVSGGSLRITSKKQTATCPSGSVRNYTSGFIGSREVGKYFPRYARFEMRAKLPHAQGLWPAFWLRHRNGAGVAEVDVMEYFHATAPGKGYGTLHLDGRHNLSKGRISFEPSSTTSSGWHNWAVEIGPDPSGVRFTFSMDGTTYHSYVDTQHNWTSADPASTWDMAINQAVGGDWTGDPDGTLGYLRGVNRCAQGGTAPNGCTTTGINRVDWSDPADSTYAVDYVRVYTR